MLAEKIDYSLSNENPYERIKRVDSNSKEFWLAKELQYLVGCRSWRTFKKIIYKVASKIIDDNIDIDNHIVEIRRKIRRGNNILIIDDFTLSRYGMTLVIEEYRNKLKKKEESKKHKQNKRYKKDNVTKISNKNNKFFTLKNISISLITCGVLSIMMVLAVMYIPIKPFQELRNLYVATAMTTRRFRWAARVFFSEEKINEILAEIIPPELEDTTNKNEIIMARDDTVEVFNVKGSTYNGKMMVVGDPAKVKVAVTKNFLSMGQLMTEFVEDAGAIGGINGSGFVDYGGTSLGGEPVGILIADGEIKYMPYEDNIKIVGFDYDDNLIVGRFNKAELEDLNLRDAVEPFYLLTINGENRIDSGDGGYGLQPRTAIGQTEDGKVLLLVINGRKVDSIGATMKDVQDIMEEYGAINCAALDGGSSSIMVYDGEVISNPSTADGGRQGRYLPSAFVVIDE